MASCREVALWWVSVTSVLVTCSRACSQPPGWEPKDIAERLGTTPIAVIGTILDKTEHELGQDFKEIELHFNIQCVLTNPDNVSFIKPGNVSIWDTKVDLPGGPCVKNWPTYAELTSKDVMVTLLKVKDDGKIRFHNANLQTALVHATEETMGVVRRMFDGPSCHDVMTDGEDADIQTFAEDKPLNSQPSKEAVGHQTNDQDTEKRETSKRLTGQNQASSWRLQNVCVIVTVCITLYKMFS